MAVQWIGSLSDAELLDYLPQLVQVGGRTVLALHLISEAKIHPRDTSQCGHRWLITPHVCFLLNRP